MEPSEGTRVGATSKGGLVDTCGLIVGPTVGVTECVVMDMDGWGDIACDSSSASPMTVCDPLSAVHKSPPKHKILTMARPTKSSTAIIQTAFLPLLFGIKHLQQRGSSSGIGSALTTSFV